MATFIDSTTSRRQDASYKKRLALFYLFNDIIQVSMRDRLQGYIEIGANVFLPEVRYSMNKCMSMIVDIHGCAEIVT